MQPVSGIPREVDLRPAVDRLTRVFPGRALIGRHSHYFHLSMLAVWRQDAQALAASESLMVAEPRVTISAEAEEVSGLAGSIHVRAERMHMDVGHDARESVFRFSQRLNAVMDGMGLAPFAADIAAGLYRVRSNGIHLASIALSRKDLSKHIT